MNKIIEWVKGKDKNLMVTMIFFPLGLLFVFLGCACFSEAMAFFYIIIAIIGLIFGIISIISLIKFLIDKDIFPK